MVSSVKLMFTDLSVGLISFAAVPSLKLTPMFSWYSCRNVAISLLADLFMILSWASNTVVVRPIFFAEAATSNPIYPAPMIPILLLSSSFALRAVACGIELR